MSFVEKVKNRLRQAVRRSVADLQQAVKERQDPDSVFWVIGGPNQPTKRRETTQ